MRYPHCKGGCGNRLVGADEPNTKLKGGRRRLYVGGYCEACWRERVDARLPPSTNVLSPEQLTVLELLGTKIADEAERRDFAEALGLVGEPA